MTEKVHSSLLTLPVEIVYRILDNLDEFTILCSVRDVCHRFNLITDTYNRYQLFTTLDLSNYQLQDQDIQCLVKTLPNNTTLTTINIGSNTNQDGLIVKLINALKNNKTLTTLDINCNSIKDQEAQDLAILLENNKVF
ncbi:unnamed protein product [Adineta steineri]|uniref:F-box domain-containing protein n=1 Tax=Adineta steineri TaxID=433720 RepID=A0A814I886_9BILA|nr:unnamed protein product [Adineta steineri]CAF1112309.1 unnamed protein product [Adineta steineri]